MPDHAVKRGIVTPVKAEHQRHTGLFGGADRPAGTLNIQVDRLLTENRFPRRRRPFDIIVGGGWARAYPDLFDGKSADSAVYRAWKKADANRYYVYEALDCDQACKVMEFIYKSTVAYLGSRDDLAETEFSIKNQADLRAQLPEIVALYESGKYTYPTRQWPDGTYTRERQVIFCQP